MELRQELDSSRFLVTLIITGLLGIASFQALPSLILGFVSELGFSERQIGQLSTFQLLGLGLGSIASVILLKFLDWRNLARFGLALLLISDFACTLTGDITQLLVLRFISGFAGGVCVSFAAYGLGLTTNTDRNFGFFMATQVGFAIIASFSFPSVLDMAGLDGIFLILCLLELLAIVLVSRFMPAVRWKSASQGQSNDRFHWFMCALVMMGLIFFFTAIGAFWTYIAPIGIDAGFTRQQTGNAVSTGLFGGLLGAYVAGLGSGLGPAIAAYTLAGGYSLLYILCALFLAVSLVWHLTAIGLGKK